MVPEVADQTSVVASETPDPEAVVLCWTNSNFNRQIRPALMNTEPTKPFHSSHLLLKTLNLYQLLVKKKHKGCNYQLLKGVAASELILLTKDRGQFIQIPITCFTPAKIFPTWSEARLLKPNMRLCASVF